MLERQLRRSSLLQMVSSTISGIGIISASLLAGGYGVTYCSARAVNPDIIGIQSRVKDDLKYDLLFCASFVGGVIGTVIGSERLGRVRQYSTIEIKEN